MTNRNDSSRSHQFMIRQGDVLVFDPAVLDGGQRREVGAEIPLDRGRIVLAYGEVTGHAHAIEATRAKLYALAESRTSEGDDAWARAERVLRVSAKAGVALRHEEHGPHTLPPGDLVVRRQREYSPSERRLVAD